MMPAELRRRAAELEAEVRADTLGPDDEHGAAALLAALAECDPARLRQAMLGEAGDRYRGVALLERAIEIAEDETA